MAFSASSQRVLLVRAGGLGDILLLRRTVARLRAAGVSPWLWAPARFGTTLVAPEEVEGLLDWESAETARCLGDPDLAPAPFTEAMRRCAAAVIYSREARLAQTLSRLIPTCVVRDPQPTPGCHASIWYEGALHALGRLAGDGEVPPLRLSRPTGEEWRAARALLAKLPGDYVALHPGSGSPRKNWATACFGALIRDLSPDRPWLLIQGPADQREARWLSHLPGAIVLREPDLRVLGAVLSRAGLYVGNDSGVSHLAAAWGAPTLALFGPTDARLWAPVGPLVEVLSAPGGDLGDLSVAEVTRRARTMLSGP